MPQPLENQIRPQDSDPQQQQQAATQDPFKGVDMDLLDDQTKEAITKAQSDLQRLQSEAQQGATAAQQLAETQYQLQQLQAQRDAQQRQNHQQPQGMDQELVEYYIQQGIPADQAEKVAKMNSGAFGILGRHLNQNIQQQLAPITSRVVESNAESAFNQVVQNDPLGIMQQQDVREKVWVRLNEMAQEGRLTSPEVAQNLARIYYVEHIEKNGMPDTPTYNGHPPQQSPKPQQYNGIPRMPGNFNQPPASLKQQKPEINMTAEEQAAMAATVAGWVVKPKAFQTPTPKVTRG